MGANANIYSALCSQVASAFPGVPIAWPNKEYLPTEGVSFIEVGSTKPDMRYAMGINGMEEHTGIFVLTINVPKGTALDGALEMADSAKAVYHRGATCSYGGVNVRIEGFNVGAPIPTQKAWTQLPCLIPWRCHVNP